MVNLQGVPVLGYLFWTISDNWEWADGYGPKFGLVAVDRANGLARVPRPSYHLFTKVSILLLLYKAMLSLFGCTCPILLCYILILLQVATSGKVLREDRVRSWNELQTAAKEKKTRPFCRAVNKHGLMYAGK